MKLNLINLKNNTGLIKTQGDLKIILNYRSKLNRVYYIISENNKIITAGYSVNPQGEINKLINKYGDCGWEIINYKINLPQIAEKIWQ